MRFAFRLTFGVAAVAFLALVGGQASAQVRTGRKERPAKRYLPPWRARRGCTKAPRFSPGANSLCPSKCLSVCLCSIRIYFAAHEGVRGGGKGPGKKKTGARLRNRWLSFSRRCRASLPFDLLLIFSQSTTTKKKSSPPPPLTPKSSSTVPTASRRPPLSPSSASSSPSRPPTSRRSSPASARRSTRPSRGCCPTFLVFSRPRGQTTPRRPI